MKSLEKYSQAVCSGIPPEHAARMIGASKQNAKTVSTIYSQALGLPVSSGSEEHFQMPSKEAVLKQLWLEATGMAGETTPGARVTALVFLAKVLSESKDEREYARINIYIPENARD